MSDSSPGVTSWIQAKPYIFFGDWSWNNFYGHSPLYADSRRAVTVVSYWGKYMHKVLFNCLEDLSPHRKSVSRLTNRLDMTLTVLTGYKTNLSNWGQIQSIIKFQTQGFYMMDKCEFRLAVLSDNKLKYIILLQVLDTWQENWCHWLVEKLSWYWRVVMTCQGFVIVPRCVWKRSLVKNCQLYRKKSWTGHHVNLH